MATEGFEQELPAIERLQTYASEHSHREQQSARTDC